MICAKFVDDNYISPCSDVKFDKDFDSHECEQLVPLYKKGVPIKPSFLDCFFNNRIVAYRVKSKDVRQQSNGTVLASRGTYVGEITRKSDLFKYVLSNPGWSFYYAFYIDKKPNDDTRNACSKDKEYSLLYSKHIDGKNIDFYAQLGNIE